MDEQQSCQDEERGDHELFGAVHDRDRRSPRGGNVVVRLYVRESMRDEQFI